MSNKIEGIWIGEKDLSKDEQFLLDAQNEMQSPSLVDAMSNNEVASEVVSRSAGRQPRRKFVCDCCWRNSTSR